MQFQQQQTATTQNTPLITPINPTSVIEHGESPTAIILAIAILIAMLMSSMAALVHVLGLVLLYHSKSSSR